MAVALMEACAGGGVLGLDGLSGDGLPAATADFNAFPEASWEQRRISRKRCREI